MAVIAAGLLAEDDIDRPAGAGAERAGGTERIDPHAVAERQQEPQPGNRQCHPEEVDGPPRENMATASGPVNSSATAMPSGTVRSDR